MENLKIGIYQMNMHFADSLYNHKLASETIEEKVNDADILVLPETWNLGFFPKENLKELANDEREKTIEEMSRLAKSKAINIIAGSIIEKNEDSVRNTALVFNRYGAVVAEYSKIHLFSYMGEDNFFLPGNSVKIFFLDNVKCAIIICYDLRFTEMVRYLALQKIDILFVVAQWPEERIEHWIALNKCRAIENQIFVVAVNSCGKGDNVKYGGHSMVIDPWGREVLTMDEQEGIRMVDIDLSEIKKIRNTINIYKDRKYELYKILV